MKGVNKNGIINWTPECQEAFESLKSYLVSPPILTQPVAGEPLFLYLAVANEAVSACLIREDQGKQLPVYYVSHVLRGPEVRYSTTEKIAYSLLLTSRKLRPYFQSHDIQVLTNYPLRAVLRKPDLSGRMAKWVIELSQFDIQFRPRTAIKGQALADFLIECYTPEGQTDPDDNSLILQDIPLPWTLFVDGSSTSVNSGAGVVLTSPEGFQVRQSISFTFKTTSNCAEYEALLAGLKLAQALQVVHLKVYSDSQLVVNQVLGNFSAKVPLLAGYLEEVRRKLLKFKIASLEGIPRSENLAADSLAKMAT